MLPSETSTPAGEVAFGNRLMWISIVWIVGTVLVGILLVLLAPMLIGVY